MKVCQHIKVNKDIRTMRGREKEQERGERTTIRVSMDVRGKVGRGEGRLSIRAAVGSPVTRIDCTLPCTDESLGARRGREGGMKEVRQTHHRHTHCNNSCSKVEHSAHS